MNTPTKPVAEFAGVQPACVDIPAYELWRLLVPVAGKPAGRVVPRCFIEDQGLELPERTDRKPLPPVSYSGGGR